MSTSPVTLDLSKSVPLPSPVKLDLSQSVPIQQGQAQQQVQQQPDSILGGIGRRVMDTFKGALQMSNPLPQTWDAKGIMESPLMTGGVPLMRMTEGALQQGKQAGKQAIQQAQTASQNPDPVLKGLGYARAGVTGLSVLDPLATGAVSNVNQLSDQGRLKEAAGQGLTDAGMLALGSKTTGGQALSKAGENLLSRMLLLGKTPEGAYESALKPSTTIPAAQRAQIAQTGIQEGIPISQKGLERLGGLIDQVNNEISNKIQSAPNRPISTSKAMNNAADLYVDSSFGNQVNPASDLRAIEQSAQEFHDTYGNEMPAERAQAVKQGTYRALSNKYGELGSASTEAQKSLARGLKDELANQFPELSDLNARDSRLINLNDSLERAVARIGNHQLMGIGTPIAAGAVRAVTGSGKAGAIAGVMKAVLDNPVVKSNLAIALGAGKTPAIFQLPRIAAYSSALGRLSQPQSLPFLPGSSQSPGQSSTQAGQQ